MLIIKSFFFLDITHTTSLMYLPYSFSEDSWVEWICLPIKYSLALTK